MGIAEYLPPTATRVERNSAAELNRRIREHGDSELHRLENAEPDEIASRLRQLEHEWDVERVLQLNASIVSGLGIVLAARIDRRFMLLSSAVFAFLAQHALQGWCPPIPLLRRLGVRTVREIERERHALKAMRGDFDTVPAAGQAPPSARVRAALAAVDLQ